MITLAPIAKNIQNTLKQKIAMLMAGAGKKVGKNDKGEWVTDPIGTTLSTNGEITQNYMFARVPWLRMVSFTPKEGTDLEAVIIQGGELSEYGRLRSGLENREVNIADTVSSDGKLNFHGLYQEGNIPYRPIAGIKDIDVGYKGGGMKLGATREARITWTCWDFEDLERLQIHFLKEGKSVLLEWGWTGLGVLQKDPLLNIFTKKNGKVVFDLEKKLGLGDNQNLNQQILQHIQDQKGHYDAMFGLVTNYTWSVRDDGGFDCQTSLIAPGVTMLQKTVQKTSRAKTFSRLPLIKGVQTVDDLKEEPEKHKTDSKGNKVKAENPDWTRWDNERKALDSGSEATIKAAWLDGSLAPYITFREYMSDFSEQIKANMKASKEYGCFESDSIPFKVTKIEKTEDGKGSSTVEEKDFSLGKSSDGSSLWVTWGWFEDNVLSRFFGTVAKDSKVIGEFRSIEHSVDNEGNYRYVEDSKTVPIMQATRFKNSKYLVTTDASKWIIIKNVDPVFINTDWKPHDSSAIKAKFWSDDPKNTPTEINKNTKEHLVIRNVLFNVKFLSDKLKDEMDLLSGVTGIWNAFASEYGGVFRFKVEYDDTGHRLFLKEQSYSQFKVEDYITTMKEGDSDISTEGKPTLFVFPTFEAGSIVKSNNLSAKLPNRMKIAAMYGANKPKRKSKEDVEMSANSSDDLISIAWGRLGKERDIRDLDEGSVKLKDVRKANLKDLISEDMDFPSRGNRNFGRQDADTQQPLIVGGKSGGTIIHKSIWDEIEESAKEELLRRKRASERETTEGQGEIKPEDIVSAQDKAKILQEEFITQTGKVQSNATATLSGQSGFYEWIETDDQEGSSAEDENNNKVKKTACGYPRVKYEILNQIDKSLRSIRDGIFKDIEPIIPVDFNMDIDGTGGLYPGNSFHSSYIPDVYKKRCLFQITGVDHRVSSGEWTTQIKGQIRAKPMDSKD